MRKISFEENISWAAGHMLGGKYYEKYRGGKLTAWGLNYILQHYRVHRFNLSKGIKWYQFKTKIGSKKLNAELDQLIKVVYGAACWGRKVDLSKYGVKQ